MATLAEAISATSRRLRVSDPSARIGARYKIGDELVNLIGYWDGVYTDTDVGAYAWVPDTTAWYVDRGVEGTQAIAHDAEVTVSEFDVTAGGGATVPALASVLAEGHDADGLTITNLAAPSESSDLLPRATWTTTP